MNHQPAHHRCRPLGAALLSIVALFLALPVGALSADQQESPFPERHAKRRVIVGFKPRASQEKRSDAIGTLGAAVGRASPLAEDAVLVKLPRGTSVAAAVDTLGGRPGVAFVEPDYWVKTATTSDDPFFLAGDQWGMYGNATSPSSRFGTGAAEAWAGGSVGRRRVLVGVIDEGVAIGHPDLTTNIWTNPFEVANGVDDDDNGYIDDINGWDFSNGDASVFDGSFDDHGTHVAGTIGAHGGNGLGVAGVNWRTTLVSAKFLGPKGGWTSDAIGAIDYLTDLRTRHGLDIVATNNSWGGGGFSQALQDAIDRAGDAGILFVAAAGNDGVDTDASPHYPSSYRCVTRSDGSPRGWDCIVSVANLRADGAMRAASNRGAVSVDLGAPGTDILSTSPGDGYAYDSGTSMAAAHVTGAAALCASIDPTLGARALRSAILDTAAATDSMAGKTATGGRLDVGAMARRCAPTPLPAPDGSAITIDDLDAVFSRGGGGWREASNGYAGHHYWVPTRESRRKRTGFWRPTLDRSGLYEILVRIPRWHATSRRATYRILTADGWAARKRSQSKHRNEWLSLGVHRLSRNPVVKLTDHTAEPDAMGRRLAFDAIRFVPVLIPAGR